ncbi:hypothetical protein PN456_08180 [Nodularia spumigena CS-586/05]|nr:hypothetical protein [Nodularia spumigena CS-586/05]
MQRAFEDAYQAATKPITRDMAEAVLNVGLNDLEPRLMRHGYNAKVLAELLNIRVSEVNSFTVAKIFRGE